MKGTGEFSIGSQVWPGTSKLIEEMGELQQILGKLIGVHGQEEHWDGNNMRVKLVEEIGDLLGAITFFQAQNLTELEQDQIYQRMVTKWQRFESWHAGKDQQLVASSSHVDEADLNSPPSHPKTHKHAETQRMHDYNQVWTPGGFCCSCELGSPDDGCTT
jgi:hypothetical protein